MKSRGNAVLASRATVTETRSSKAAQTRRAKTGAPGRAVVPRAGTVGGGRAKGQKNRLSRQAKENLEEAFEKLGGVAGLVTWGKKNRSDFYKIWARLIPKDMTVNPGAGLEEMLERLSNGGRNTVDGGFLEVESK